MTTSATICLTCGMDPCRCVPVTVSDCTFSEHRTYVVLSDDFREGFRAGLERAVEISKEIQEPRSKGGGFIDGVQEGRRSAAEDIIKAIKAELHQPDKPPR